MKKSIAFACDTPIQVLNAINLKEKYFKDYESDIFICNHFATAESIYNKIVRMGLFSNAYLVKPYKNYSSLVQKFVTIVRLVFPGYTLSKYCNKKIKRKTYDYIAFSFIAPFTITLFGMAQSDNFILLEDGIGTYVCDMLKDFSSPVFRKIAAHTFYGNIFSPQRTAVYNSDMIVKGDADILKLHNNFSDVLRKKIEVVFDYKENTFYKDNRIVYLTQPLQENMGFSMEKAEEVIRVLKKRKNSIVIRIHPRDNADYYEEFNRDSVNNLWELECIHQISDESVLIGGYSTTQFMPKILKNAEPYIIFLYKILFNDLESDYWRNIETFIEKFRTGYSHPNRIIIPQNVGELEEALNQVMKEEN